jgi:hypothetical protein
MPVLVFVVIEIYITMAGRGQQKWRGDIVTIIEIERYQTFALRS